MKQQKVDINAVIANLGNGNVTTGNIVTGDIRKEANASDKYRKEFLKVLEELQREIALLDDKSSKEAVELIEKEIQKDSWDKKLIKFLLDTVQKTGVTLASEGIISLGTKAVGLLQMI